MSESVRISALVRIERPVDVVRQQFRDIDHRIRNNVHPDIQYEWVPTDSGERKVRTTFHILGVPQHDVSLLEDAPDGSVVMRCIEGKNAEVVLVHRFVAVTPHATTVETTAEVPAERARGLLGSLVMSGLRQVLRKALAEDKRDLEGDHFVAGKAAGNLDRALALLRPAAQGGASFVRPLNERSIAARRAVLEATCLIAVADGRVEPGELDAARRVADLIGAASERDWLETRARELAALAVSPRIVEEATRIGRELVAQSVALEGITTAVVVALVSDGMSLGELELLRELARVAGVSEGALPAVIESAERALMTTS
jgi:hypothetical protein